MKSALEVNDISLWASHDKQFHEAIFDFTENSRLIDTARKYNEQNKRCKDIVLKLRPLPWDSVREHNELIDLIEETDAPKAREIHLKHWKEVSKQFIVYLENYHFLDN